MINSELNKNETRRAVFDIIKQDLTQDPPKTDCIKTIINELIEALCKFVPSKKQIHVQIKKEIYQEDINIETMPVIIYGLISWIEKFQCPVDDVITKRWRNDFQNTQDYLSFIVSFLEEYYDHSEKVYRQVWEARKRFVSGESVIPPEHRHKVEGKNGIPFNMKTGRN